MRLFRFICWLRGFHANWYKVTHMEGQEVFGDGSPCRVCGKFPLSGKTQDSYLVAVWPYHPEPEQKA